MSFLSDLAKQGLSQRQQEEYQINGRCFNCNRGKMHNVQILSCRFALNPVGYEDFLYNPSICMHCINLICETFQHDFYLPNDDLIDGYLYIKKHGFFQTTKDKKEDQIVFVMGVRPNMPEDYHVLLVDSKYEEAVQNVMDSLKKGARRGGVKNWKDLLH